MSTYEVLGLSLHPNSPEMRSLDMHLWGAACTQKKREQKRNNILVMRWLKLVVIISSAINVEKPAVCPQLQTDWSEGDQTSGIKWRRKTENQKEMWKNRVWATDFLATWTFREGTGEWRQQIREMENERQRMRGHTIWLKPRQCQGSRAANQKMRLNIGGRKRRQMRTAWKVKRRGKGHLRRER